MYGLYTQAHYLIQKNFRHALDGDRERNDGVGGLAAVAMTTVCAVHTEDRVTRLAEHELLSWVYRTLGHDIAPLAVHEIEQLVNEEGGWKEGHAPAGYGHRLPADGTPQCRRLGALQVVHVLETRPTYRVRAWQQLGRVLVTVV